MFSLQQFLICVHVVEMICGSSEEIMRLNFSSGQSLISNPVGVWGTTVSYGVCLILFKIEAKGIFKCGRKSTEPLIYIHADVRMLLCRAIFLVAGSGMVILWSPCLVFEIKMHTDIN